MGGIFAKQNYLQGILKKVKHFLDIQDYRRSVRLLKVPFNWNNRHKQVMGKGSENFI